MKKIINWTFGSFFRTLGRILVYIFLGFLLSYFLKNMKMPKINIADLFIIDGYADVLNISDGYNDSYVYITDNNILFNQYYFLGDVVINNNITTRFKINTLESLTYDYSFVVIDLCSNNEISVIRTSDLGQSCANSCFANQIQLNKTNNTCISNGNNGYIYRITLPVSKWDIGASSEMRLVNDRLTFSTLSGNNVPLTLYGFYLSNSIDNSNFVVDYSNAINNITNQSVTNSNNIINNQNQNKTDIINNQNANTDREIESQKVCTTYNKDYIIQTDKRLQLNGNIVSTTNYGITDYIKLTKNNNLTIKTNVSPGYKQYTIFCFYNADKTLLSCEQLTNITINTDITIPDNTNYVRFTLRYDQNAPLYQICKNGNQALGDNLSDIDSSINNSDITGATSDASNFFSNFTTDTHGLTGIITAPLSAIQSLTSSSCSPLVLPLPFVNQNLTLPCMRDIYTQYFGGFMQLYDIITLGIISYWVMVRIFGLVKDFKNPEHDEIEVVDL